MQQNQFAVDETAVTVYERNARVDGEPRDMFGAELAGFAHEIDQVGWSVRDLEQPTDVAISVIGAINNISGYLNIAGHIEDIAISNIRETEHAEDPAHVLLDGICSSCTSESVTSQVAMLSSGGSSHRSDSSYDYIEKASVPQKTRISAGSDLDDPFQETGIASSSLESPVRDIDAERRSSVARWRAVEAKLNRDPLSIRREYGPSFVQIMRSAFMDGRSPRQIARQHADDELSERQAYEWCVLGRGYEDAYPEGFEDYRRNYSRRRWSQHDRIDQLSRAEVREMRRAFRLGESSLVDVWLRIRELDLVEPLTGLDADDWSVSDLFVLLFGASEGKYHPYPWVDASRPAGYADWWKRKGRTAVADLMRLKEECGTDYWTLALALGVNPAKDEATDDGPLPKAAERKAHAFELDRVGTANPNGRLKGMPFAREFKSHDLGTAVDCGVALIKARVENADYLRDLHASWFRSESDHASDAAAPAKSIQEEAAHAIEVMKQQGRMQQRKDVEVLASWTGFSLEEAYNIYRLVQEILFRRAAGRADLASQVRTEMENAFAAFGEIVVPDTTFSHGHFGGYDHKLMRGRMRNHARRARKVERRLEIKRSAARRPKEPRPFRDSEPGQKYSKRGQE